MVDLEGEALDDLVLFGPFRLVKAERRLEKDGRRIELGDRAFDILQYLIASAPRIVGKSELLAEIWRDVTVDEGNLPFQVNSLRIALGEDRVILTVRGRGYCFVSPFSRRRNGETRNRGAFDEPRASLPRPLTAVIGRERDIERLRDKVAAHRLVTLGGSGGIGETRLAIELGWRMLDQFPDGVALIDLAPLADAALIGGAVVTALRVSLPRTNMVVEALAAAIGGRRDRTAAEAGDIPSIRSTRSRVRGLFDPLGDSSQ